MKAWIPKSALLALALVLTAGSAMAQGNGQPSDLCDGLQEATPGLYGLCLAFHNVEPCVPNLLEQDPFAGCEPKDGRLLEAYDDLKGSDDPRMPGTGGECPCLTEEFLAEAEGILDYYVCAIDSPYEHQNPNFPNEAYITSIWSQDDWGAQTRLDLIPSNPGNLKRAGMCSYNPADEAEPSFFINSITYTQYEACREIIVQAILAHPERCENLCNPECPE
jgi:hypothetical protein